jgi:hypothetical protein
MPAQESLYQMLRARCFLRYALVTLSLMLSVTPAMAKERWSAERANAWYAQQPWPVGSDYIPADAINQLEMWQADTFDPQRIDLELGWAEAIGMNTMRVFLHDLLWQQDREGFEKRIDTFLTIAQKHHIRPVLVIFDSCWGHSTLRSPEFITPDGCRVRAQRLWRRRPSIRDWKST